MKTITAIFENSAEMLVAFTNTLAIGEDGWAQIAPFGDFPGMAFIKDENGVFKKEMAIQRVDRQAVEQMVAQHNESRRGIKKFLNGRPIFLGHPDAPGGAARWPDATPKGVFANVECRENGFFGEPILTDEGERLVASKKVRALSGRWEADEYLGEEVINGRLTKIFRPTKFLSAGLTDRPNLPVEMFNEAEETKHQNSMNKQKLIALLASLGFVTPKGATFSNEATDDDLAAGLTKLEERAKLATTLEGEKATFANEKAQLEGRVTTLTAGTQTLTTERDTARTQFANERKARITGLLDTAITDGRITAADRPTWETRLANEAQFANEAEALGKLHASTKTKSLTLLRGDRKVEISNADDRREMVAELVNEEMNGGKLTYDVAFGRVQKKFPQLFEAMEQPATAKKR